MPLCLCMLMCIEDPEYPGSSLLSPQEGPWSIEARFLFFVEFFKSFPSVED